MQASPAPAPNPSPQPVPEVSSKSSAPPSTLRVPTLYPDLSRFPPSTQARTNLKQETSPQDPAPSPAPFLPLWEVAGAEGIVGVHVPLSNLEFFFERSPTFDPATLIPNSSEPAIHTCKKAEGPQTPQQDLLSSDFKIFNNQEE